MSQGMSKKHRTCISMPPGIEQKIPIGVLASIRMRGSDRIDNEKSPDPAWLSFPAWSENGSPETHFRGLERAPPRFSPRIPIFPGLGNGAGAFCQFTGLLLRLPKQAEHLAPISRRVTERRREGSERRGSAGRAQGRSLRQSGWLSSEPVLAGCRRFLRRKTHILIWDTHEILRP